jgi:hypothetical protein
MDLRTAGGIGFADPAASSKAVQSGLLTVKRTRAVMLVASELFDD